MRVTTTQNKELHEPKQKNIKQFLSGKKLVQNYSFNKNKEGTLCMELFSIDCSQNNALQRFSWDPNWLSSNVL